MVKQQPIAFSENQTEWYHAGLSMYEQEFRTLGERTNSFLIFQSIFAAAATVLLTNQRQFPVAFDVLILGIVITGLLSCILHFEAGISGARAASIWRKYLRGIEDDIEGTPLNKFYSIYNNKNLPEKLLKRLPLPSAWLFSPIIFVIVWFGLLSYTITNYILAQKHSTLASLHEVPCWLFSIMAFISTCALIYAVVILIRGWQTWNNEDTNIG